MWWNAANTVEADFGSVIGSASGSDPSITTYFTVSQYQSLGSAENSTAVATSDLTVTDMLPYRASAQTFTLTGPDGSVWTYAYANGVVTLSSGNPRPRQQFSHPRAQTAAVGSGTLTDGKIVADFGAASSGQWASIYAAWQGGQYQPQPGLVQQTAAVAGNMQLVDQLAGGTAAQIVTLNDNGTSYVYNVDANGVMTLVSGDAATAPGVVGVGQGIAGARWIYWDASNSRIVASLGNVAAGYSASIAATFSGGLVLNFEQPGAVRAVGLAVRRRKLVGQRGGRRRGLRHPAAVRRRQRRIEHRVRHRACVAEGRRGGGNARPARPPDLDHRRPGPNYFDVTNIVVTDVLSDGQHWKRLTRRPSPSPRAATATASNSPPATTRWTARRRRHHHDHVQHLRRTRRTHRPSRPERRRGAR